MTMREPFTPGHRPCRAPRAARRLGSALLAALLLVAVAATGIAASSIEDSLRQLRMTALDRQPAPAFTLSDLRGTSVSLADFKGHVVLLYFWATW